MSHSEGISHTISPEAVELYNLVTNESNIYDRRRKCAEQARDTHNGVRRAAAAGFFHVTSAIAAEQHRRHYTSFNTQQILEAALLLCVEDAKHFERDRYV